MLVSAFLDISGSFGQHAIVPLSLHLRHSRWKSRLLKTLTQRLFRSEQTLLRVHFDVFPMFCVSFLGFRSSPLSTSF